MTGFQRGLLSVIQSWSGSVGGSLLEIPVTQSMSVEGALWFPNLLVADPTHALPVILAASMFTNVTWGWKVATAAQISKMGFTQALKSRAMKGLRLCLQILSIWLAPMMIAQEVPAGLVLYWVTSSLFATAQSQILPKYMGVKPPINGCIEKGIGSIYDKDTPKGKSISKKALEGFTTKILRRTKGTPKAK